MQAARKIALVKLSVGEGLAGMGKHGQRGADALFLMNFRHIPHIERLRHAHPLDSTARMCIIYQIISLLPQPLLGARLTINRVVYGRLQAFGRLIEGHLRTKTLSPFHPLRVCAQGSRAIQTFRQ